MSTMITKAILQEAIGEQVNQAAYKMKDQILELRLEYKNIQMIDNLWEFSSLTKLELNNNDIKKIQGLDYMVNLTWLNLSFNKIKTIEGLETLVKLKVLNLSNNKISVIENMDTLEKLTHLLISNNLLGQLDNVLYLKKFKKLATVHLQGNPFCNNDDYKYFIAAFVPNLMYLDFRPLDEGMRNKASAKYFHDVEKVRREELEMQENYRTQEIQEAEEKLHKDAFVEFLNGSYLFNSMFKDDPEAETLRGVPEIAFLLQTFKHQMEALCMQLFTKGLAEHRQREAAVNSFLSGQNKVVSDYQQKATELLRHFDQEYKEWTGELMELTDPDLHAVRVKQCSDEINQFCQKPLTLEFQLVSILEANMKKFEALITDMVGNLSETVQGIFAQIRELEDGYYHKVQNIAVQTLEKVGMDRVPEDIPDDVMMLFTDKDRVMDVLATSHDNHLLKINDRETELITRLSSWQVTLMKEIQDNELKRNRMNILAINRHAESLKENLEKL